MMNLVADIGNTTIKIALISDNKIVSKEKFSFPDITGIEKIPERYSFQKAIISSVREIPAGFAKSVEHSAEFFHILTHRSGIPFEIIYDTPETLGMDRLAAVAGVYNKYGLGDVLVIDAGTAITYDLLLGGKYVGGSISPGIEMRFRALNTFTGKLPLVGKTDEEVTFPATDTVKGIRAGVINGVVFEINEYIRKFGKHHTNSVTMITGGDSEYLGRKIDHKHLTEPDLVLLGLNNILEYNAHTNL